MDSLKLHLNAVKIKNSFTMYKNIEINGEQNSKYEMRPIQKKSSYRIGNANGVGVRLIIKSAEADNLSVTDSVNGFSPGSRVWQTPLFSRRTESDRCLISKVADVLCYKELFFIGNFEVKSANMREVGKV